MTEPLLVLKDVRAGYGDAVVLNNVSLEVADRGSLAVARALAASAALWRDEAHVSANRALYAEKFFDASVIFGNRFGFYRPDGGFFLWLDVGNGEEATRKLWRDAHVKVLPGAYACRETDGVNTAERYIRVALVHDEKTTREGLQRLAQVL